MKKFNSLAFGGGKILFHLFWLSMLLTACEKDATRQFSQINRSTTHRDVSGREAFSVTKSWLQTFQQDLIKANEDSTMSQTYSIEQITAGMEALVNFAAGASSSPGITHVMDTVVSINLVDNGQTVKSVYQSAWNFHLYHISQLDTTEAFPLAMSIHVDTVINSQASVKITSVFGINNSCISGYYTSSSQPCSLVFGVDEGFRIGAGDKSLELMNFYYNPPCEGACGETQPCEEGVNTAFEEEEARINFYYPKPSKPGRRFVGFINIDYENTSYLANTLFPTCGIWEYEIGTCLEANVNEDFDPLNCIYCVITEAIANKEYPFEYPVDKYFIRLNLAVDYVGTPSSLCDEITNPWGRYWFGKPVFSLYPVVGSDPLAVDLSPFEF